MPLLVQVQLRIDEERNLEELLQGLKDFQAHASGFVGVELAVLGAARNADEIHAIIQRVGLRSVTLQTGIPLAVSEHVH